MCVGQAFHAYHTVHNLGDKICDHKGHLGCFLCTTKEIKHYCRVAQRVLPSK